MTAPITTYSFKQLCQLYGVSSNTMRRELKKMKLLFEYKEVQRKGKTVSIKLRKDNYFPADVAKIFDHLGTPDKE